MMDVTYKSTVFEMKLKLKFDAVIGSLNVFDTNYCENTFFQKSIFDENKF